MVTSIVLAAGESKRMGEIKQLLPWEDKTIIESVVFNLIHCQHIKEIRVVLGANYEKIEPIFSNISEKKIKVLINENYKNGMITTVWTGLKLLPKDTEYILFTLGDMPLIRTATYNQLMTELIKSKPPILAPTYMGSRGHPLIVHKTFVPDIFKLNGPGGLRNLLKLYPEKINYLEIEDEGILIDIDTPEEYEKYKH
jgi:molybdenum cofactor cytidylyltransferase